MRELFPLIFPYRKWLFVFFFSYFTVNNACVGLVLQIESIRKISMEHQQILFWLNRANGKVFCLIRPLLCAPNISNPVAQAKLYLNTHSHTIKSIVIQNFSGFLPTIHRMFKHTKSVYLCCVLSSSLDKIDISLLVQM